METTQGLSLCSYLYLNLTKMPCFSCYLLFFFCKIREQEGGTGSGGGGTGGGKVVGQGEEDEYGANNVYACN
jgi:hypothetical protein